MRYFKLLLVFSLLFPGLLAAQEINPIPLKGQQNRDLHGDHIHVDGFCTTLDILNTREAILAQEEFVRWDRSGRPGWTELQEAEIAMNIGDVKNFFVVNFDDNSYDSKEFELKAIGDRAVIWVERSELGPNKVSDEKIAEMLQNLENLTPNTSIDPTSGIVVNNRDVFGNAPNVDGTGKVSVLLTNIPRRDNGLTTGGYFTSVNLSQTNPNSNKADIIYINTALIYNPNRAIGLDGALSTLAHEDQHLIHANFATLSTFLNEGQSEWAEIVNGYEPRPATNLQTPEEVNRQLLTWRSNDTGVLFDYARAGLLHSYIAERVGVEAAGTITRSGRNGIQAYERALRNTGLFFEDILLDFHTANLVNDLNIGQGFFGYRGSGRASIRTSGFASEYPSYLVEVSTGGNVAYGGAEVKQWTGVENFFIELDSDFTMRHRLVAKTLNSGQNIVIDVYPGEFTLDGEYESVKLLSAKVLPVGSNEFNEGTSSYSYTTRWDPLPVERESISYSAESAFLAELPGDPAEEARRNIARYATRFSSTISGIINQVTLVVNGGDRSLQGTGTLKVSLHANIQNGTETETGASQPFPRFEPGMQLREKLVDLRSLSRGTNVILMDGEDWQVQRGSEYWVVFELIDNSPDGRVEFLLDEGSTDVANADYFPTRSRIFIRNSAGGGSWGSWSSNNNFLVGIQVTGLYDGPLTAPSFTTAPQQEYRPFYGADFTVSVQASGTPAPVYIWTKDGQLFRTGPSASLTLPSITEENSGTYSVRAANYAGYTDPIEFVVEVVPPEFNLAQNYPNPFNNSSTIGFSVAEDGFVTIDVFDVTGRQVATLTRPNRLFRRGFHEVSVDAEDLASGVYIYHMRFTPTTSNGNRYTNTRKMLLVR
jgi:hypothetical protein